MKRIILIIISVLCVVALWASKSTPQEKYIEKYASLAVAEMYRSGVPASITLAQGMLESRYGLSDLAAKGNNHFGIKCHKDWKGKRTYHDDDAKGECFRVYKSPEESFKDHSDFLRYRDRYKFLFDLQRTDYKGWAYGLKKAGYATDPAYPTKLIKLIEDYKLHQYDLESKVKREKHAKEPKIAPSTDQLPPSPNSIEQPKIYSGNFFHLPLSRPVYTVNGVPFINSTEGETYASIAAANNLFHKEILKYNDLESDQPLNPGTVVYLQPKKNKAPKGLDKHIVEGDDETLRDIAQRYGVKLNKLCKMNGMSKDRKLYNDDVILLRK